MARWVHRVIANFGDGGGPDTIAALEQLKPDTPDHTVITPDSPKRFLETH